MNDTIEQFIGLKRVAVVGVSRSDHKYGSIVYRDMEAKGYEMVPVNPEIDTFDGKVCYPSLSAIPEPVEGVVVVISPWKVPAILQEAASLNIKHVWLQPGAESEQVFSLADELELDLIHTFCVMVEARKTGAAPA